MDPILVQKQVRDNAEDLRNYLQDLKSWESEMKRKESEISSAASSKQQLPPVRSKVKKLSKGQENKTGNKCEEQKKEKAKISACDYSSWDKFDVDKACEDLDNEVEKESEEENIIFLKELENSRRKEEALYEKEQGNDFVKKQKWNEAIKCYNRAIKCYPDDAVFYANRAACYLKLKDFKSVEADCTTALQLDPTYVKAYQRRASARAELGQLLEARADLLQVIKIEPKNGVSRTELTKIEKKLNLKTEQKVNSEKKHEPVFSKRSSQQCDNKISNEKAEEKSKKSQRDEEFQKTTSLASSSDDITELKLKKQSKFTPDHKIMEELSEKSLPDNNIQEQTLWPEDTVKLVQPVYKPPHLRSKKPLKRIVIKEVDNSSIGKERIINESSECCITLEESKMKDKSHVNESSFIKEEKEDKLDSTKVTSKEKINVASVPQENIYLQPCTDMLNEVPPIPTTSVEFYVEWKKLKSNPQLSYLYLKQIPGTQLPQLFRESLESGVFSDIISIIKTVFLKKKEPVLSYLTGLTKVRRFGALVMFLSEADKIGIKEILHYCKDQGECSQEELSEVLKKYELC